MKIAPIKVLDKSNPSLQDGRQTKVTTYFSYLRTLIGADAKKKKSGPCPLLLNLTENFEKPPYDGYDSDWYLVERLGTIKEKRSFTKIQTIKLHRREARTLTFPGKESG